MTEKNVELKCPDCGSDRILEFTQVVCSQPIYDLIQKDNGEYEVGDWGASEADYDNGENMGFACDDFCQGQCFPLEHFVVKV